METDISACLKKAPNFLNFQIGFELPESNPVAIVDLCAHAVGTICQFRELEFMVMMQSSGIGLSLRATQPNSGSSRQFGVHVLLVSQGIQTLVLITVCFLAACTASVAPQVSRFDSSSDSRRGAQINTLKAC